MSAQVCSIDDLKLMPRRKRPFNRSSGKPGTVVPIRKGIEWADRARTERAERFMLSELEFVLTKLVAALGPLKTECAAQKILLDMKSRDNAS